MKSQFQPDFTENFFTRVVLPETLPIETQLLARTITEVYHQMGGVEIHNVGIRFQRCVDLIATASGRLGHGQEILLRPFDTLHKLATNGEVSLE